MAGSDLRPVVWLAALAVAGTSGASAAGCGGAEPPLGARYVAVHNALVAAGMTQSGSIQRGVLAEGQERRLVVHMDAGRCTTLVALGSDQARDLDLRVRSEGGDEVARDETHDPEAAVRVCPERAGAYQVVVRMAKGRGDFVLGAWSAPGTPSAVAGAVGRAGMAPGGGTCASPLSLPLGRPVQGDTRRGRSFLAASCAEGNAPEQVYRLDLAKRSQLSVRLQSSFDAVIYVVARCDDAQSEVACNDDADEGQTGRSELDVTLDAGTWFLVVDGYQDEAGDYELVASARALPSVERVCQAAPELRPGQPVSGTTAGAADQFQASCAGGARSTDRVYRIQVPQRSRLRVRAQTDHDGALYLRSQCARQASELACDDDYMDPQHAVVHHVVDEGTTYVYVDGFSGRGQTATGNFTLAAQVDTAAGSGVSGDACGDAEPVPLDQALPLDTFSAHDDLSGSCGGEGAPDVVFRIDAKVRSRLRAKVHAAEFDGVMYLRDRCQDSASEKACEEIPAADPRDRVASLDTVVSPGPHYLVVDGQGADAFGSAQLEVTLSDTAEVERSCRRAPLLRPGHPASGTTSGHDDAFQGSCARIGGGPDTIYRLRVRRKSHVLLQLTSQFDAILHVRRDCVDRATEVACNDDYGDNQHARVEGTFSPGTYFVVVDGFRPDQSGDFTLDTTVEPL